MFILQIPHGEIVEILPVDLVDQVLGVVVLGHDLGYLCQILHPGEIGRQICSVPVCTETNYILSANGKIVIDVGKYILGGGGPQGSICQMIGAKAYANNTPNSLIMAK